jgi:hypothetical protein
MKIRSAMGASGKHDLAAKILHAPPQVKEGCGPELATSVATPPNLRSVRPGDDRYYNAVSRYR